MPLVKFPKHPATNDMRTSGVSPKTGGGANKMQRRVTHCGHGTGGFYGMKHWCFGNLPKNSPIAYEKFWTYASEWDVFNINLVQDLWTVNSKTDILFIELDSQVFWKMRFVFERLFSTSTFVERDCCHQTSQWYKLMPHRKGMNSIFDDLKSAIHRDSEINYRDLLRLTYPVAYPTVYTIQIRKTSGRF